MKYRFSIIACARWETRYVTEWLLYHRAIGFEHVYLYCNDDDPRPLYQETLPFAGGREPFVTFVHFALQGQQRQMYLHALRRYAEESEWVLFLDIDEFLALRGVDHIGRFVRAQDPTPDCLYFNWVHFGNNGFQRRPAGSVLLQYPRRHAAVNPFTKVLARTARLGTDPPGPFWHDGGVSSGTPAVRTNVLGDDTTLYYRNFPHEAGNYLRQANVSERMLAKAAIFHYSMKSEEDFALRLARGTSGEFYAQGMWKQMQDAGGVAEYLATVNAVEDRYLHDYWAAHLARAYDAAVTRQRPAQRNIALGRSATQSSVSSWSVHPTPEEDAAGAINGRVSGRHQCHTDVEDAPWWSVDLGMPAMLHEIWVYNRLDMGQERLRRFRLEVSDDGASWREIYRRDSDEVFGGADGDPCVWAAAAPVLARHVRLSLTRRDFLHLDQVEVFGVEAPEMALAGDAAAAA